MSNDFYRAFEDRFRGSRNLIKQRLLAYKSFIEPLLKLDAQEPNAIDLGCGRGEWLEILGELGFIAVGVDLDDHMLVACRDRGFNVKTGDALSALKTIDTNSQSIVTGFHLAEHLQFSDLQALVQESLRVLRPGGLLILETPNPENILVATTTFYLDPTHQRPIPHQFLIFLVENLGFKRATKIGLNEESPLNDGISSAVDLLKGVSPDYAIIAQKDANPAQLALFDEIFNRSMGVGLAELMANYQNNFIHQEKRLQRVEEMLRQIRWPINFLIKLKARYRKISGRKKFL